MREGGSLSLQCRRNSALLSSERFHCGCSALQATQPSGSLTRLSLRYARCSSIEELEEMSAAQEQLEPPLVDLYSSGRRLSTASRRAAPPRLGLGYGADVGSLKGFSGGLHVCCYFSSGHSHGVQKGSHSVAAAVRIKLPIAASVLLN